MIHQSILIPNQVKTLTRVSDGSTFTMAPGIIMSVAADRAGTGTNILYRNNTGTISPEHVTGTVASFVIGTTFVLVTPVIGSAKYIRAETISVMAAAVGGTLLTLLSDDGGFDQAASLLVTESVATISSRINSATGGGSGQQLTTGAATTTVSDSRVQVVTVAIAGQNIQLTTAFPFCTLVNATANYANILPPIGSNIDEQGINQPKRLTPFSIMRFEQIAATSWVSEVVQQAPAVVTTAATGSATIVTQSTAFVSVASAVNNFVEIGVATPAEHPRFVTLSNLDGAENVRIKFAGGFIDTVTGATATPYVLAALKTVLFTFDPVQVKYYATVLN